MAGWVQIPGGLTQISVGSSTSVWGVNAAGNIWRYTGNDASPWVQIAGGLSDIGVGSDGTVWGVNAAGNIFRYTTMRNKGASLLQDQVLNGDDYLLSPNGLYIAYMQDDGNFVLYHASSTQPPDVDWSRPYWSTGTSIRQQGFAKMQSDGNFVLYHGTPSNQGTPYWASNTNRVGAGSYHLDMQSDGNLVVYNGSTPLWASNTVAGVGERLNIVSGNNQTQPRFLTVYGGWPANFAPLSVVFTDSVGNPYAGKQITWTFYTPNWQMIVDIPPYGGMQTSIPVPTTTDSHGNATVNAVSAYTTDGSDGSFTIVAKSDSGLSVTFNLTIGGLRSVVSGTILAGNNQSVARSPNASFDVPVAIFAPLQVKVLKPDGTPAVGVRVGFVTGSNPDDIVTTTMNVDYNTVTTDGSGIATLSSVTAYDRTGTFTVVASIEGGNQLTFSETVSS